MDNHYGGVIWTNHALDRLRERGIRQGDAWATWRNPEHSKKGTISGSWVYYRNYEGTQIEVVAKQNERKVWLILSVWSRTVTENHKKPQSFLNFIMKKLFSAFGLNADMSSNVMKRKLGKWPPARWASRPGGFWTIIIIILLVTWRVAIWANKTTKIQVTQVSRGELVESVSTSGSIKADQYSQLTFPSGGLISWVGVKIGQKVVKGQAIAQLDTISLNATYQQALNNYRNYQATADNVLDTLKGHDADESFTQRATRTTAEVNRDNAYSATLATQDNLRNAMIFAPFAGIVDTVSPSSSGINVTPGAANYTVVNPDSVYFDAEVTETDIPRVAVGQTVSIKLDAYPADSYQGTVTNIGMVAFTSSTGGNAYHIRISLPENTNMKFKIGMGGDIEIIFNKIENVLKVP
ncbi:MAG: efflux RND transporter periplasmic adaptor subunit, partial [Candidatus Woesebacteria bacterium]|nr:efflux RND transporter periplasmic adaptor subunit [Candidatus Woesebacteria bacterium]